MNEITHPLTQTPHPPTLFYKDHNKATSTSSAAFYTNPPPQDVPKVSIICSTSCRRAHDKTSFFFVHPLFQNTTTWPSQTPIACYHCTYQFSGYPVPLPIEYEETTRTYHCGVGLFCRGACAKAYMIEHPRHNNSLCMMLLNQLMTEMFGYSGDFGQAPPMCSLQKFGGPLTIEAFRSLSQENKTVLMHVPRLMVCNLAFELIEKQKLNTPSGGLTTPEVSVISQETATKQVKKIKKQLTIQRNHHGDPENVNLNSNENGADMSLKDLMPGIALTCADGADKWDIRNLSRPSNPLTVQRSKNYNHNNASLFESFCSDQQLEQKVKEIEDLNKSATKGSTGKKGKKESGGGGCSGNGREDTGGEDLDKEEIRGKNGGVGDKKNTEDTEKSTEKRKGKEIKTTKYRQKIKIITQSGSASHGTCGSGSGNCSNNSINPGLNSNSAWLLTTSPTVQPHPPHMTEGKNTRGSLDHFLKN
jgi:hypothetical protein